MNKISDKEIKQFLSQKYDELLNKYNPTRILGLFITGPINYGYADDLDEAELVAIYLPTFEDLCCQVPAPQKLNDIQILDIRHIYKILNEQELTSLELLFTNYYIITDKYNNLFNEHFYNNRERYARIHPYQRIVKAADRAYKAWKLDNNFEAARLQVGADLYVKNHSCEECFHPTAPYIISYLESVKEGYSQISINDLEKSFEIMLDEVEDSPVDTAAAAMMKKGVLEMCGAALHESVDLDSVIAALTKTEQKAFEELRKEIPSGSGIVSISKIVEKTGISRPVWKNLFNKLENNKIISTTNMGVKGTEIKLL